MHEKKKLINDSFQPLESLAVNLRKQNSSNKLSVSQSMVLTDPNKQVIISSFRLSV